jgi:hypothetical protein
MIVALRLAGFSSVGNEPQRELCYAAAVCLVPHQASAKIKEGKQIARL